MGIKNYFVLTTGQISLLVFRMALAFMDKIQEFMVTNKITKLQNAAERNKSSTGILFVSNTTRTKHIYN